MDLLITESEGQEGRYIKLLVELDLSKPLLRGTRLKYKQQETWIQFKYEQLPIFCYYCGCIGHNEKRCVRRKEDLSMNCLKEEQFGAWLRANNGRSVLGGLSENKLDKMNADTSMAMHK